MNDIFEHKERKVYKRTFLQQVDVRFEYPILAKDELTHELVESVGEFFRNHFQLEQNDIPLSEKEIFLKDDEQQLALSFTPVASMLSVGYKNYNTFYDSVLSNLYPLKEYVFKVLGKSDAKACLRKVNIFSTDYHSELAQEKQERLFLQNVFSSAFLNAEESKSRVIRDGEDTELSIRSFKIDDFNLEIRTYFLHRESGFTSLFLDSVVSFDADSSSVEEMLTKANSLLYDSYHWAVSEGIIDIMNKDAEV
jgi:hypothetical protein